jgi:hypothetical protein
MTQSVKSSACFSRQAGSHGHALHRAHGKQARSLCERCSRHLDRNSATSSRPSRSHRGVATQTHVIGTRSWANPESGSSGERGWIPGSPAQLRVRPGMTGSYYSAASFGADNLFSRRRRRSRGRKYQPGSRGRRRQDLSQEFWRPGRRIVVAERTLARDDDPDRVFQGVTAETRDLSSEKFVLGGGRAEPPSH